MSAATPNRFYAAGFVKNVTSSTAPSLTNPALNTGFLNQVVTVGSDSYFVDSTGTATKLGSAATPESVTFGVAAPTSTTAVAGDRYMITSDGTRTGIVSSEYVFDGTGWVLIPICAASGVGTIKSVVANRGVDVILDNVKIRMNPTGSTMQIASVSGSFGVRGATQCDYGTANTGTLHQVKNAMTVTTTYQTVDTVGWSFPTAGSRQIFDFFDVTTAKRYRVTMIVNDSYVNNAFTIERLL